MIGMGGNQSHFDPSQQISVLHWNVHWGGKGKGAWKSIMGWLINDRNGR